MLRRGRGVLKRGGGEGGGMLGGECGEGGEVWRGGSVSRGKV